MSTESGKTQYYEYIIVGCGGVGSAAVYWLSKRSKSVLGLEQFKLGHDNGGSQDLSRIIRLTYHEDMYTKLTPETYKAWSVMEKESGIQVVFKTGSLQLAERGRTDYILDQYATAMDRHGIDFERWDNKELMRHYPQFTVGPEVVTLYQKDGGLVDAALGNSVHIQLARGNGATILENCGVTSLTRAKNGDIVVHTTKGTFQCRRIVITAGGWLNHVLGSIGVHIPVTVTQEQVTYFGTSHMKDFTKDKFPIWFYQEPRFEFYSLPIHCNSGTKIGIDAGGPPVTVNNRSFEPDPVRVKYCTDLLEKILPTFLGPVLYTKTCIYTITPDRNFVIDTCAHKGWPDVIVCCGAGHAYKFSCLFGKILSEMAVDGRTQYDISGFNIGRQAISDPNFQQVRYFGSSPPKL